MSFWRFMDGTYAPSTALNGSYDPWLVLLSFAVASMAGYAALNVAERVGTMETRKARWIWLGAGALAMGIGIWAMHFLGMLAFSLPIKMAYDPVITAVSVVPAIVGSALALAVMSRPEIHQRELWGGALLMAAGIGAMHYTGMEAMEMGAELRYDPVLFAVSIVVAHFLGMIALYTKFLLGGSRHRDNFVVKLASSGLMGGAVAGMHYTGMTAAYFFPKEGAAPTGSPMDPALLVAMVSIVTTLVLAIAIFGSILDSSRTQMMQAVESNPGGFAYYEDGQLVVANSFMRDLFPELTDLLVPGTPYERIIREWGRVWGGLPGEVSPEEYIAERRNPGPDLRVKYEARLPDKRIATVEEHGTDIGGLVSVWHDITEMKGAQQQLIQSEKMASLGQMVGGVAHEINTPLAYVRSNVTIITDLISKIEQLLAEHRQLVELIQSEKAEAGSVAEQFRKVNELSRALDQENPLGEARELLGDTLQGIDEISHLVVNLRDFCRMDRSKLDQFDVNQGLEKTLVIAHNELKHRAEVIKDFGEVPPITASPSQINQVFLNLINNAAQALGEKGHIWLTTRADDEAVEVVIRDDGSGIPEEVRKKIFDPFFTTKEVGQGTGLGLSIAYRILEQHQADIQVSSAPGEGTEFRIRFPIAPGEQEPMKKTA